MAAWEIFKLSAKRAADKALKETSDAADLAGLHIRLKALEAKRNEEYEMLGRLTYRQLKTGVSQAERIAPVIENLDKTRALIKKANQQIEETRALRDERRMKDKTLSAELEEIANEIELEEAESDEEEE